MEAERHSVCALVANQSLLDLAQLGRWVLETGDGLAGKPSTLGDFSAVITGLLLALTLPPGFPLWMAVVAGFIGIETRDLDFNLFIQRVTSTNSCRKSLQVRPKT